MFERDKPSWLRRSIKTFIPPMGALINNTEMISSIIDEVKNRFNRNYSEPSIQSFNSERLSPETMGEQHSTNWYKRQREKMKQEQEEYDRFKNKIRTHKDITYDE